jgi:hypothetical protein
VKANSWNFAWKVPPGRSPKKTHSYFLCNLE